VGQGARLLRSDGPKVPIKRRAVDNEAKSPVSSYELFHRGDATETCGRTDARSDTRKYGQAVRGSARQRLEKTA